MKNDDGVPWGQWLFDQPFILLALGLIVMFGFYTIWGYFEVVNLPAAPLP